MKKSIHKLIFFWFSLAILLTGSVDTVEGACGRGNSEPPFLSFGVDSNLLLLFDNSGSMLDLAYRNETEQCYDETYNNSDTYSGYFDKDSWYEYNFGTDNPSFTIQAVRPTFCSTADYFGGILDDQFVCVDLVLNPGEPPSVSAFAATGNFLNWASASKFDIQKNILTGGKYDSVNENLQMESRGCMGRRFVKQVDLAQPGYRLVLGVRGPMEVYRTWLARTQYSVGDIVQYKNILYQANNNHTSDADGEFEQDQAKGYWTEYKDTRWYPDNYYPPDTAVYDTKTDSWHWTREGGTSLSTAADITEDTAVNWVPYDGTSIEIFDIVEGGFNATACEQVMELIASLTGTSADGESNDARSLLGQIKQLTEECMGFNPGGGNTLEKSVKASFNHAMQECWYYNKFGIWKPGTGSVTAMKAACRNVYDFVDPEDITPWNSAYVCAGTYQPEDDKSPFGYVGRCWEVPGELINCAPADCPDGRLPGDQWSEGIEEFFCSNESKLYQCNKNSCGSTTPYDKPAYWDAVEKCDASSGSDLMEEGWTNDDFFYFNPCTYKACTENDALIETCSTAATCDGWTCEDVNWDSVIDYCFTSDPYGDLCVEQGIRDFCAILSVPEVIDPSDSITPTDEPWNVPAYLFDSGVIGQLGLPLTTMTGNVRQAEGPQGILQKKANELRIGAMAFNAVGAKTECESADPTDVIKNHCPEANKDGSMVISRIRLGSTPTGDGRTHVDDLCGAINDIRATSWTPLAEAMYGAIGYYTQNTLVRLHDTDFQTDADAFAGWQADQAYAPGSYLLSGSRLYHTDHGGLSEIATMTENAGLNDDTGVEWKEVIDYLGSWSNNTLYGPNNIVSFDSKLYITYSGGTSIQKPLSLGGPLYDEGVIWEPLFDPVANWCQENHILVITEGASTADISPYIVDFVAGDHLFNSIVIVDPGENDPDLLSNQCTDGLIGSTYFDDLVFFARNRDNPFDKDSLPLFNLYPPGNDKLPAGDPPYPLMDKKSLTTNIVVAGSLRDDSGDDECNPAVLMNSAANNSGTPLLRGENPQELEANLLAFFNDLRQRASAGSAASVISSARGGEGAIYQAIFWPERENDGNLITWVGDVHSLFVNDLGQMYEDTNGNRTMDPSVEPGDGGDLRVCIKFDTDQNRAMACLAPDENNECREVVEITEVNFLWSANDWLSDNAVNTAVNRANYISNEKRRHVFTWNDLNNNGMVDDGEVIDLEAAVDWDALAVSGGRGPVVSDFGLGSDAEVDMVVSWLRGEDAMDESLRSRWDGTRTWRLGDIIHSTPMTVANPAEAYHLIYNDFSYAQFLRKYRGRRHMIYFGANDGLLHAVNAGFYSEREKKFCLVPLTDGTCDESVLPVNGAPELGTEMWAYLPYNLQPHVKCLTDPNYVHKYYVDQRPRIFDVQIFQEEDACRDAAQNPTFSNEGCIHPNGWGTILVGGMRFGGTPVTAAELGDVNDSRQFISSYFILDITNPEEPPVLLGELTREIGSETVDLGYSTVIPTMIIMKDNPQSVNKWYLLFGSGPHDDYADVGTDGEKAIKGISAQEAKVSVLPLDWVVDSALSPRSPLRIPADRPDESTSPEAGTFVLYDGIDPDLRSDKGFVSDMITVDFDINPSYRDYKADSAYFGTVQGNFVTDSAGQKWDGGGLMYRLVTKAMDTNGFSSFGIGAVEDVTAPWQWEIKPLIDLTTENQPITASASVGTDGYNFWIYFGTGRYFDSDDKTDRNQQAYYGIKEPIVTVDGKRYFTWEEVEILSTGAEAGHKGLLRVDEIMVGESDLKKDALLTCLGRDEGDLNCLPFPFVTEPPALLPNLANLEQYISGSGQCTAAGQYSNCVDGWYKKFHEIRERNVGQATLLGGLVTFTTYQPFNDVCTAEGVSYLYGVYYLTGTAWHENVFGTSDDGTVLDKLIIGRGLATTPNLHVGSGDGSCGPKAFVQTSTGEIVEIQQENLPLKNYRTGLFRWKEYNR
jgi:hypothetical protein